MAFYYLLNNVHRAHGAYMDNEIIVDYIAVFIMSTIVGAVGAFQAQSSDVSFRKILIERITTHGVVGLIIYCLIEGLAPEMNVHLEYGIILLFSLFGFDKAIDKMHTIFDLIKRR